MSKRASMIVISLVAAFILFHSPEAGAVANGDGVCSVAEVATFDCGQFGPNVIEFRGASIGMCTVDSGTPAQSTVPCTVYMYLYTGGTTNQVNLAIPLNLTQVVNDANEVNCSQYITNGSGDPTTGFGKNLLTLGICRIANNASSLPVINNDPGNWNILVATDPSFPDKNMPLSWQLRQSKTEVFAASIVGPVASQPPVYESGASLTTSEGKTISYTLSGDQVIITSGNANIIPMDQTKLCLPTLEGQEVTFSKNDMNFTCETISYVTEQCDVKTTGSDPCRYIGGRCIQY